MEAQSETPQDSVCAQFPSHNKDNAVLIHKRMDHKTVLSGEGGKTRRNRRSHRTCTGEAWIKADKASRKAFCVDLRWSCLSEKGFVWAEHICGAQGLRNVIQYFLPPIVSDDVGPDEVKSGLTTNPERHLGLCRVSN